MVVGLPNNSYKPITNTASARTRLCKLQKRFPRLAAGSDKACQWSVVLSGYSGFYNTTNTGHHDVTEILLKVALSTINQIKLFLGEVFIGLY